MKKVNAVFQKIPGLSVVLMFCLFLLVMLAGVASANTPAFVVNVSHHLVGTDGWPGGVDVTVNIYDDEATPVLICTDTQTSPSDGQHFNFNLSGCPDVQPGNYVVITDGITTKDHVVAGLTLTEVNYVNNTVAGTLDPVVHPLGWVALQIVITAHPWTTLYNEINAVQADIGGNWEIDLNLEEPPVDPIPGMLVDAAWIDEDDDSTHYGWGASMNVAVEGNFIHTWGWPSNVEVTLEIYGNSGAELVYTDTKTSLPIGQGFNFNFAGQFDLRPGHIVTLFESSASPVYIGTVSHTVTDLTVDCAGTADGIVRGRAAPGSRVLVQSGTNPDALVFVGSDGRWVAGPFDPSGPGVRVVNLDDIDNGTQIDREFTTESCLLIPVEIDIKPGSDPNSIYLKSAAVIPVAILTTEDFDATTVDPLSVEFGPYGATESHGRGHIKDVDGDGDMDLMLHFKTKETGIQCGDTEAGLTGETFGGEEIDGVDSTNTVRCD